MSEAGRPRIEIDFEELRKLCQIHCTLVEIADWFQCSEDTIERRVKEQFGINFADYYKKNSSQGKMSLRRKQFEAAQKGNITMLIWLGKQYLGQKDQLETSIGDKKNTFTLSYRLDDKPHPKPEGKDD